MSDRWKHASRNSLALSKSRLVAFPLLLLIVGIKVVTWQHWARWVTITSIIAIVVVMLAATALLVKVVPSRTTASTGELTAADERDLRARDPQKFRVYAKTQLRASVVVLVAGIVLFFVIPDHWRQAIGWHTRWDGLLSPMTTGASLRHACRMTDVQKSLTYDAVFILMASIIAVLANGTLHTIALVLIVTTVLKAPYDVWEARRSPSE